MHEIETGSAKFRAAPINSTHGGAVVFEVETLDADVALVRVMLTPLEAFAIANKLTACAASLINRPPYSVLEHQPHPGATPLIQGFIP
jgi:hypothetical protein